jgi:hypothetical protein
MLENEKHFEYARIEESTLSQGKSGSNLVKIS